MPTKIAFRLAPLLLGCAFLCGAAGRAADHNDPNAINSIFADVPVNPADLYDLFGFPNPDEGGGERVVLALTFAAVPRAGAFDPDMLYSIKVDPDPRLVRPAKEEPSLDAVLRYAEAVKDKFLKLRASEVRVRVDARGTAHVSFINFPEGSFSRTMETNRPIEFESPGGHRLQIFVGGRDDAFFNDLPGFFRSINYGPQFYRIPRARKDLREFPIPKTLLELEGNTLFNFDPARPGLGTTEKADLPPGPVTWSGAAGGRYKKDADGNFRFVYSGKDAQAGRNVNAVIVELPLAFLTREPRKERIVNAWGESRVLKAAGKITTEPDNRKLEGAPGLFARKTAYDRELEKYKLVDTDGVPFADAALSERQDDRQLGANDIKLARHFVQRFGHLGWGFAPSLTALGIGTCFDYGSEGAPPVSVLKTYSLAVEAFPRVKKCLFQELNMPDDGWRRHGVNVPLKRPFEIFIPNVCAVDMDTNGSWPFGRRLEDQVATRFLSVFLDHAAGCGGRKCTVESMGSQALWDALPIEPKTPPNPLANDKAFLAKFPYLAEPW